MKTFDVYNHPTFGYQAVKRGFGWPAFFFTAIWAFVKRMWGVGFALIGVFIALGIVETLFEEEHSSGGVLFVVLAQIAVYIVVGIKGNEWRRNNLVKRGYEHVSTLEAQTPEAAIGIAARPSALKADATSAV